MKTRLISKINGYPVYLLHDDFGFNLECNDVIEPDWKLTNMISSYMLFTEYFTVEESHIVINKDQFGRELFGMVLKFSELKAVYNEAKKRY